MFGSNPVHPLPQQRVTQTNQSNVGQSVRRAHGQGVNTLGTGVTTSAPPRMIPTSKPAPNLRRQGQEPIMFTLGQKRSN